MHIKTYQMPSHEVRAILRIGLCWLGGAPTGGAAITEDGAKPPATTAGVKAAWLGSRLEGAGATDWIPGAGAGSGLGAAGAGAGGVGVGGAGAGGGGAGGAGGGGGGAGGVGGV